MRCAPAHVCLRHGWSVSMHSRMQSCRMNQRAELALVLPCPCMDMYISRSLVPKSFAFTGLARKFRRDSQRLSSFGLFRGFRQGHSWSFIGRGDSSSGALLQEWIPTRQRQTNELLCMHGSHSLSVRSTWDFFPCHVINPISLSLLYGKYSLS